MPRGIPAKGFRMTKNRMMNSNMIPVSTPKPVIQETDDEIRQRIGERFTILDNITEAALKGDARAVIVSGPAGLGKSFTVEQKLAQWDPDAVNHIIVKGYVRTTGLYKTLYQYREKGQVVVFDDSDSIFFDDKSLNMLKAVLDTTERRVVSYLSEYTIFDEKSNENIPSNFEFNGTVIFITNLDFDSMIAKGHKLTPHFSALMSRAHYIDMAMRSKRDYMIRIQQVIDTGILASRGLTDKQQQEVLDFVQDNQDRLRELSIRMVIKIASARKMPGNWQQTARVTCLKS